MGQHDTRMALPPQAMHNMALAIDAWLAAAALQHDRQLMPYQQAELQELDWVLSTFSEPFEAITQVDIAQAAI
jgi:hypothetical protein